MLRLVEPLQLRLFSTSSNLCTYGQSLSFGTTTNFHFPQQFWWQFQFSTGGRCNYLLSLTLTITRFREVAGRERLTTVGWRSGSQRFWNLDYSMFHYYLTIGVLQLQFWFFTNPWCTLQFSFLDTWQGMYSSIMGRMRGTRLRRRSMAELQNLSFESMPKINLDSGKEEWQNYRVSAMILRKL